MGSTEKLQVDGDEGDDVEILDIDELMDFSHPPNKFTTYAQEIKYWKKKALGLRKCCERLMRRGGGGQKTVNVIPPNNDSMVTQLVSYEEVKKEAVMTNGHVDKAGENVCDDDDAGSVDLFENSDVEEDVDAVDPIPEIDDVAPLQNDEDSNPPSPTITIRAPVRNKSRRKGSNNSSTISEDDNQQELVAGDADDDLNPPDVVNSVVGIDDILQLQLSDEGEEQCIPPSPAATVFAPRKSRKNGSNSSSTTQDPSSPQIHEADLEEDVEPSEARDSVLNITDDVLVSPPEEERDSNSLSPAMTVFAPRKKRSKNSSNSENSDVTQEEPLGDDVKLTKAPGLKIRKKVSSSSTEDPDTKEVPAKSNPVKLLVDKQKPSTSKRAVAEMARQKRRLEMKNRSSERKLGNDEATARHGVLDTSSDESDHHEKAKPRRHKRKSLREKDEVFKSRGPITDEDKKNDAKLSKEAMVKVVRLADEIKKELEDKGYIVTGKDNKLSDDDDDGDDEDSDSSIRKLDRAIKQMARQNYIISKRRREKVQKAKAARKKDEKAVKKKKDKSASEADEKDVLLVGSGSESDRPAIKVKNLRDIVDHDEMDDMDDLPDLDNDDKSKKKKVSREAEKSKLGKGSKTVTPQITIESSTDDGESGAKKNVLDNSDSDKDEDSKTPSSRNKRKQNSDDSSDSEVIVKRTTRSKRVKLKLESDDDSSNDEKKKKSGSDDDESIKSKSDNSDFSDDSDFKDSSSKKKKKKAKRGRHSSSDEDDSDEDKKKKAKKKRRRIKQEDSDGSSIKSDDSDIQVIPSSQSRKKIKKIMDDSKLKKSTREAEKEEEERKRRVAEKQKLFNGIFENAPVQDGKVTKLVLEVDPITKKPIIEVDESIVKKLKPHQVQGIKFMYTTCFESVEQMNRNKGGGCILAHCMGLGKTLQTVAFTHTMLDHRKLTNARCVLIVCPLNTVGNWYKEYQIWLEEIETERRPKLHALWEGKTISQRTSALQTWKRRGGVGIMHYDFFRLLVNNATGTTKTKTKTSSSNKAIIRETLLDPGPDIVVCDEGHLLKNHKSKLSEALSKIQTIRRVVLTGTPLQNNLVEYHTMVNFVKPNLLGSLKEFQNRFVNPIKNGQCKDSSEYDVKIMKRRAHVLHSKLDGCVQRLDYSVLTPYLPTKHEYCIIIKLSDKQKDLYRDYLAKNVSEDLVERSRKILLHYSVLVKILAHPVVLTFMKEKESDELTDDEEGSIKDFICDTSEDDVTPNTESGSDVEWLDAEKKKRQIRTRSRKDEIPADAEDEAKTSLGNAWWCSHFSKKEDMYDTNLSGKLVVLQEILKTCETIGDRVLIFSQYLTTLNIIEEFLGEWDQAAVKALAAKGAAPVTFPPSVASSEGRWRQNIEYFRIDGQTKTDDRQKHCETFNRKSASKAKLFLISTKAGGLGINLFGANRVVIFDASWNPSNDMQSIFRVYRFGQQKPCYIYRFVAQATMEEKIYNRQVVKLALSSRVVDEHQVERHFKFDDINEMYKYNPDEKTDRPTPPVPKDRLLADLLISHKNWIDTYFEHDSLLVNKEDETLTEEERQQAWEEYRHENEHRPPPIPNMGQNDVITFHKVKLKLHERFPDATDEQVVASAVIVVTKIQELRGLLQRLNYEGPTMPEAPRKHLDEKIRKLQAWISQAMGGIPLDNSTNGNGPGIGVVGVLNPISFNNNMAQQQQYANINRHSRNQMMSNHNPAQVAEIQRQMMANMQRVVAQQQGLNRRQPVPTVSQRTFPPQRNMVQQTLPNPSFFLNNIQRAPPGLMSINGGTAEDPLTLDE